MEFKTILYEKKNGVARITLNRPEVLNAISVDLISEVGIAAEDADKDDNVRAIVIAAKGRMFSAGADLKATKEILSSPDKTEKFLRIWHKTFRTLEESGKPVICAVQGLALAGGLELVNACDIVIAAEDAQLGDQHANFGLLPGGGNSQLLPRLVGIRKAKELLFTGDRISAAEAERLGLVNKVVPADKLEEAITEMVEKVTKNKSPLALRRMKYLVNKGMQVDLHSGWEIETQTLLNHFRSEDMAEGLAAFEERRKPVFKGK